MNIPDHIFSAPPADQSLDDIAAEMFDEEPEVEEVRDEPGDVDFASLVPSVFERLSVEIGTPPAGDPARTIAGYAKASGIKGEAEFYNWLSSMVYAAKRNGHPWQGAANIAAYLRER